MTRSDSLKAKVFKLLDTNPLLSTKKICQLLNINYYKRRNYIYKLRHKWKFLPENERGSNPSSVHAWRGWTYLPKRHGEGGMQREYVKAIRRRCLENGWVETEAKNRWILWKDRLGRLQLFETGRVNLYIRKPPTMGKAYQLLCNGFTYTGVVTDMVELQEILMGVKFKSAHFVFDVKQRLPELTIDFFGKSNGIVIKVGDRTHPNGVEVLASYPDWAERNEKIMGDLLETVKLFLERVSLEKGVERRDLKKVGGGEDVSFIV